MTKLFLKCFPHQLISVTKQRWSNCLLSLHKIKTSYSCTWLCFYRVILLSCVNVLPLPQQFLKGFGIKTSYWCYFNKWKLTKSSSLLFRSTTFSPSPIASYHLICQDASSLVSYFTKKCNLLNSFYLGNQISLKREQQYQNIEPPLSLNNILVSIAMPLKHVKKFLKIGIHL